MIKYTFIYLVHFYTTMYSDDDEGDPFAPPVENMTTKLCRKGEVCYHEDYYGQQIRGCRKRKDCPSNLSACVDGVCCCKNDLCNTEQPPPLFNCYSGQARIEEDPEITVGIASCHSWCKKEYKVEVTYSCATDWQCRHYMNTCGSYMAKNGLRVDVCCCEGELCNRRFDGDPPFVSFEETTIDETATAITIPTTTDATTTQIPTTASKSTNISTSTVITSSTAQPTTSAVEWSNNDEKIKVVITSGHENVEVIKNAFGIDTGALVSILLILVYI